MTTNVSFMSSMIKNFVRAIKESVTSYKFYERLLTRSSGYGIRYLFITMFCTSIIYTIYILGTIQGVIDGLNGAENLVGKNIHYILNQVPIVHFSNDAISIADDSSGPIYITDIYGRKIAVIDIKNKLSGTERMQIPVVFTAKNIMITTLGNDSFDITKDNIFFTYNMLFGANETEIDASLLKSLLANKLEMAKHVAIFVFFPLMILLRMLLFVPDHWLICLVVYITSLNILGRAKTSAALATRVVVMASLAPTIIQPLIAIVPFMNIVELILQLWCFALLARAFYERSRQSRSFLA